MPFPRRARGTLLAPALLLAGALLASCGGDDPDDDAAPTETVTVTAPPEETTTASESATTAESLTTPAGEAPDVATVEAIAQATFEPVADCPDGSFQEVDDLLTTLSEEFAAQATALHSYACGGRIDQVVYAVMPDEATAAQALDPASGVLSNAPAWVAGNVVVAMNYGVEGDGVDIGAFFAELTAACGCGETRYTG
ncbi:hypothetical protein [Nocardioides antri]|uniref:DUF3558 domain-containing protein n=1 Tax=Nocardioides antri TaxID=2607659 RepID=A0A5B1M4J7_9ACTN|nr:hypothetical protein [Nocardioides antri]KAA1427586.1 hypothetical protein F0U47_09025 [Nocardioides antri]